MRSLALLIVRSTVGGLLAAHGAQKLFGWFGGPGVQGTAAWLESLRLRPAHVWARAAGLSEFGGGVLTVLGLLNPLGPIAALGAMAMATTKVHLGKPVWANAGGPELPLTNAAVLTAVALAGPGRVSIDRLLGIRIPRLLSLGALVAMLAAVYSTSREEIATIAPTVVGGAGSGSAEPASASDPTMAGGSGPTGETIAESSGI